MAKSRTDKSRYESRYSPKGFVTAAQYITELICEKKAQQDSKELPIKFWELDDWKKYYKYQILLAHKLIKEFGDRPIIAALRDKRTFRTYSLRAPFLRSIIEEKVKEVVQKTPVKYDVPESGNYSTRKNEKNSIISKLRDLE